MSFLRFNSGAYQTGERIVRVIKRWQMNVDRFYGLGVGVKRLSHSLLLYSCVSARVCVCVYTLLWSEVWAAEVLLGPAPWTSALEINHSAWLTDNNRKHDSGASLPCLWNENQMNITRFTIAMSSEWARVHVCGLNSCKWGKEDPRRWSKEHVKALCALITHTSDWWAQWDQEHFSQIQTNHHAYETLQKIKVGNFSKQRFKQQCLHLRGWTKCWDITVYFHYL